MVKRVTQFLFDISLGLGRLHINEVDHDQAAQVAQPQLTAYLFCRFKVGAQRGLLDVGSSRGPCGVYVHGHQGLGMVDDKRATRGQLNGPRVCRLDLVLDLESREEGDIVSVALNALCHVRHDMQHELPGLLVDVIGVDEYLANIWMEVVTNGSDDEARFLVDQVGTGLKVAGVVHCLPELKQIVQVPLQFADRATNARRTGNHAHAGGQLQLVHNLFEFLAILALNSARHAPAPGVVGHEHEVAASKRDVGGEGRPLVAALFLFNLNQKLSALSDGLLDLSARGVNPGSEILTANLLEGQEAVSLLAVVHKAGLQAGLYPSDDPFVDIALALLAPSHFDVEVDKTLSIDDCNAQLFCVGCVKQHAFHQTSPWWSRANGERASRLPLMRGWGASEGGVALSEQGPTDKRRGST